MPASKDGDAADRPARMPRGTAPPPTHGPGRIARWGLALVQPRWALAIADDPRHVGRAGTDLLALFALVLVAVHLRALVGAGWLGAAVGLGVGGHALAMIASQTFTTDLAFLLVGAVIVFAAGGPRRALGRAFDLACVAVVPLVALEAIATGAVRALALPSAPMLGVAITMAGTAWSGTLLAFALMQMRRAPRELAPPVERTTRGARAGWGTTAVLGAALLLNGTWVARHLDVLRPLTDGDAAPELNLPSVGKGGALGAKITLAQYRGKVVMIDLWATWCVPCLRAMPEMADLQRHDAARGLVVIAVNLDDPARARAIFDEPDHQYPMTLVFDDAGVAERYGVGSIPHVVVLDRDGVVRGVFRGDPGGAAALAETLLGK
jgi:thiol-disulfide isomerase/thioredoxin